jgi:ribosomal protein S2
VVFILGEAGIGKSRLLLEEACNAIANIVAEGKRVLFVGTKKQAKDIIKEEAVRTGQFYVSERWLGGSLTNFTTIRKSVKRLTNIEKMESDGTFDKITKKEVLFLHREKDKLNNVLSGVVDMTRLPGALFVVDTKKEAIAVKEARRLGIPTKEFLDTHTLMPITKDLHLPVVLLRMGDGPARRCPFVGEKGCTVYEDRPWACRMYPLGMALPPARAGVTPAPIYFVFEEDFCQGRGEKSPWTVEAWRADQGLDERDVLEAGFQEIVSHPWFIGGRQLDPRRMDMYFTACYDLDTFRRLVLSTGFLRRFHLEDGLVDQLAQDDEVLLRFAFRWLRFALFAEPTMRVRDDAPAPRGTV